jgi:hypothetical protein
VVHASPFWELIRGVWITGMVVLRGFVFWIPARRTTLCNADPGGATVGTPVTIVSEATNLAMGDLLDEAAIGV